MRKNRLVWGCVLLLGLLLGHLVVFAGGQEQIASKTGLDEDLFITLETEVNGKALALFVVAVTERCLKSKVSSELRSRLQPYVGKNVLYVNPTVESVVSNFPFDTSRFLITQEGMPAFVPTLNDWDEITEGFLSGVFVTNPGGASYGSGSEGLLLMNGYIDITKPFTVSYAGKSATFSVRSYTTPAASSTGGIASSPSRTPVDVPIPDKVTDLQDALTAGEFSRETIASLLGLPISLVQTVDIINRNDELRLVLFLLSPAVRDGSFSDELMASIEPLIGSGAVMVWALSPTGSEFTPWKFFIQQNKTNCVFYSDASFVELTEGFLRSGKIEAGQILAGVMRFPEWIDTEQEFTVSYGSSKALFDTR
jgi:hypothetical protein